MNNNYQLFKISEEYLQLISDLEEAEGVLTPELENRLQFRQEDLEIATVSSVNLINMLDSNIKAAETEITRIEAFITRKQKVRDNLKHSLLQALLLFGKEDKNGVKRLSYNTVELSTRKSKSIEIIDENLIPNEFKKIDVTINNISITELTILKTILDEGAGYYYLNLMKAVSKISKTELKPEIEKIQPLYEEEISNNETAYKDGSITQQEFLDKEEEIFNKYPLLNGARQEIKLGLTIK